MIETERRLYAVRYANGDIGPAATGDDAERVMRTVAGGEEEVVTCMETIIRTPWVTVSERER